MELTQHINPSEFALLETGILTKDKIRKYPLSQLYVNKLIKIYALNTRQYYIFKYKVGTEVETDLYITDKGLDMYYTFCETHNPEFVRKTIYMRMYTDDDLKNIRNLDTEGNRRMQGLLRTPGASKSPSGGLIIIHRGNTTQQKEFKSFTDARNMIKLLLTMYVPESLELYRIRHSKTKGSWKVKAPVICTHYSPRNEGDQFDKHRTIQ